MTIVAPHPSSRAPLPQTSGPRAPLLRQVLRFVVVGLLGTAVSALLYLVFRSWWDAVPADLAALLLSTLVSTEANRRFTFDGARADHTREYVQSAGSVLFYAVYSSVVLVVLNRVVTDPTGLEESLTVAAASVLGGTFRFLVLRSWVFGNRHATA